MPDLKSFFETPQKARLTIICLVVSLATLGAVILYIVFFIWAPGADPSATQSEAVSSPPLESVPPAQSDGPAETAAPSQPPVGLVPALTIDEARALALADAGVEETQAEFTREALAEDNGIWVYEFRFRTEGARYDYKLNANTGDVRGKVKETISAAGPESAPSILPLPAEYSPPVETDPLPSIPAVSQSPAGSPDPVLSPDPSPGPAQPESMYIGMDRAKAIALDHAGLSASQVRFTSTRMDREDGSMVYEIEFRQGQTEYEYEIDAATGRILEYEQDTD